MKIEITSFERTLILSSLVRREADLQSFLSCPSVKNDPDLVKSITTDLRTMTQLIDLVGGLK